MTMHIVMLNDSKEFVWITDRLAAFGNHSYGTVEKITYLKEQKFACSIWGDWIAMYVRDELIKRVMNGNMVCADDPSAMATTLRNFTEEMCPNELKNTPLANQPSRGFLMATFGSIPHVYRVGINWPPVVAPIVGHTTGGDDINPALLFTSYYYELSDKSIGELLCLGIHTMRLASILNRRGISGIDAWVCQNKAFTQLKPDQINEYLKLSLILDDSVLKQFRNAPNVIG